MTRTRTIAAAAIIAVVALAAQALDMLEIGRVEAGQSMAQSRLIGYQVTFQFSQNPRTAGTTDQLTVVFANRSVEGPRAPRPFFGEDIVQEFSFSGVDFVNSQLRFTRRVSDKSFLEARYIRVVNYGSNSWDGEQISLTVDGQDILRNVRMAPRLGIAASKGFQKFNPREWAARSYWEAELPKFRAYGK